MFGFHSREVKCECGADLTEPESMQAYFDMGGADRGLGKCNLDGGLDVVWGGRPFTQKTKDIDFRCSKCGEYLETWSHTLT